MDQDFAEIDSVYFSLMDELDFDRYDQKSLEEKLAKIQAAYRPFLESKEAAIRNYALTRFLETVYGQKRKLIEIAQHQCLSLKEEIDPSSQFWNVETAAILSQCDEFLQGRLEIGFEGLLDLMEKTENLMVVLGLYVPRQVSVTREMEQLENIFYGQAAMISLDSDYEENLQKLIDLFQPFADSNYPEVSERAGKLFLNRVYAKGGERARAGKDKDIYSFGERVCKDLSTKIAQLQIDQKDFPSSANRMLAQCELFLKGKQGPFNKSFFASVESLLNKIDSYTPDPTEPVNLPVNTVKTADLPVGTTGANFHFTKLAFVSYLLETYPQLCYAGVLYISKTKQVLLDKAKKRFARCLQEGKEWIFLTVSQDIRGSHANMLVINYWTKEAELFEPNGSTFYMDFVKFKEIERLLQTLDPEIDLIRPAEFCPRLGPQFYDPDPRFDNELGGYCVVWSFYWLEQRVIHGRVPREQLYNALIKQNLFNKETIKNYARWMILIKDIMLDTFLPQITSIKCEQKLDSLTQWREKLRDQQPIPTQDNVLLGRYSSVTSTTMIDFRQMIDNVFESYNLIQTDPVNAFLQLEAQFSKVEQLRQQQKRGHTSFLTKTNRPEWIDQVILVLQNSLREILLCYDENLTRLLGLEV